MAEGMLGKFKMLIGIEDVEEDDEDFVPAQSHPQPAVVNSGRSYESAASSYKESNNTFVQPKMEPHSGSKVVSMQNISAKQQFKLVVTEPESFDECPKLANNLKSRKPVIVNLEKLETTTASKIFDFLNGVTYALNGSVQQVANKIFVFAPDNVDVLAEKEAEGRDSSSRAGVSPWRR